MQQMFVLAKTKNKEPKSVYRSGRFLDGLIGRLVTDRRPDQAGTPLLTS